MSNYEATAVNPSTGKREKADFMDNYFGRHRYGIRFKDGETYPIEDIFNKKNEEKSGKEGDLA